MSAIILKKICEVYINGIDHLFMIVVLSFLHTLRSCLDTTISEELVVRGLHMVGTLKIHIYSVEGLRAKFHKSNQCAAKYPKKTHQFLSSTLAGE